MASPVAQPMQFIDLVDFTPGIYSDWMANGSIQGAPLGSAQLDGTFGCVSSPAGGLMPAPRKIDYITQAPFDADASHYPNNEIITVVNSLGVLPGRIDLGGGVLIPDIGMHRFCYPFIGYQYFSLDSGADFYNKFITRAYKTMLADGHTVGTTFDLINDQSAVSFILNNPITYGPGSIIFDRSNAPDPTMSGFPVCYASQTTEDQSVSGNYGYVVVYPDNSTPNTDSTVGVTFSSQSTAAALLGHQNRVINLVYGSPLSAFTQFGSDNTFVDGTEILDYQAANDYTTPSGLTGGVTFSPEQPTGYGSWVSMNASQMLLIKVQGGGVAIQGDIVAPSVIHYPGIASTGYHKNVGTPTPKGYAYGATNGVWLWPGGDTATNLATQLTNLSDQDFTGDPWRETAPFWRVTDVIIERGASGSFSYSDPFIYCPNNFVYDMRTNGWWRHTNPADGIIYNWHQTILDGYICASPLLITDTQTEAMAWFDLSKGQSTYQWRSQPIQQSRGRFLDFRELDMLLVGSGQVRVTVSGLSGTSDTQTFTVNTTTTPQLLNVPISAKVTNPVVTIRSDSGNSNPAPRVLECHLGYYEAETARGVA